MTGKGHTSDYCRTVRRWEVLVARGHGPSPQGRRNGGRRTGSPYRHADPTGLAAGRPDHDPLAAVRTARDPAFDVFLTGTVFLDVIFTGLEAPPELGTEVWSEGMGSSPGGIANLAVAMSRLGLRTSLAAAFGGDVYGDFCWDTLATQEGVDLSAARRFPGWHSPVTVSLAYLRDRSMITHGHAPPVPVDEMVPGAPPARAGFVELSPEPQPWVERARASGVRLFADVGWDSTETWSPEVLAQLEHCYAFLPNAAEAVHYTRSATPEQALSRLAEHVPVAVVTCGPDGAMAIDGDTGERARVPGLAVEALDPTGAGDVFAAAFVLGTLARWPLERRLRFANLCAALSVQQFGGSLSAPGWADIAAWWEATRNGSRRRDLAAQYAFLDAVLPTIAVGGVRRAWATIGFRTT